MDKENLIILVQQYVCLYNLQHDCDKILIKDNCWKETAGVHEKCQEQAAKYFVHHTKIY